MSEERDDLTRDEEGQPEPESTAPAPEPEAEVDAAKLSDEAAAEAARAFLGTAEPEEEVSVDEVKSVLRRAGAVAEAEPVDVAPPVVEAQPEVVPPSAPTVRFARSCDRSSSMLRSTRWPSPRAKRSA